MLETNNIKLRAVEPSDLQRLYEWENDTALWSLGSSVAPYSKYALKEFIKNASEDIYTAKQLRLMVDFQSVGERSRTIGCVDLFDFDFFNQRTAFGLLIDKKYRRKGLGLETMKIVENYCFSFLKLQQIYCHIPANNTASIHLFEKVGFKQSGELHKWIRTADGYENVFIYQLINQ
ncbi:MAG: GNAT family N-acetyltransferase [Prevotellaceae bacterium]|nr:GNAT family N-acetyltransferase [Prevotellaceae bacterium]